MAVVLIRVIWRNPFLGPFKGLSFRIICAIFTRRLSHIDLRNQMTTFLSISGITIVMYRINIFCNKNRILSIF